jgi:hypothetical protein
MSKTAYNESLPNQTLSSHFVDITPAMAKAWLEHNANNRSLNQDWVDLLARAMREGKFDTTHQGIAFDADGNVIDGQHRLHAIIASGVTVRMLVTRGLTGRARGNIDNILVRRLHHHLHLVYGERSAKRVVSWLLVISDLTGDFPKKLIPSDAEAIINQYRPSIDWGLGLPKAHGINAPVLAALVYAYRTNPEKVDAFAQLLIVGAEIPKRSPVLALKRSLAEHPKPTGKDRKLESLRTLRAVTNFLDDQPVAKLQVSEKEVDFFRRAYKARGR